MAEHLTAPANADLQLSLLRAVAAIDAGDLPAAWVESINLCLTSRDADVVAQALAVVNRHDAPGFENALEAIALTDQYPPSLRITAAAAIARRPEKLSDEMLGGLLAMLNGNVDSVDRLAAAQAIGGASLSKSQLARLAGFVRVADPLELPGLLRAFEGNSDQAIGLRLVDSLMAAEDLGNVSSQQLVRLIRSYPDTVTDRAKPLLDKVSADAAAEADRLRVLSQRIRAGNAEAGRNVFFGTRASCSKCHRVGREGGQVGPNLSQIAAIRNSHDFLEAIVLPSASIVRGFEPYDIITTEGRVLDGLISRQTPQALYLRLADLSEVRIERSQIEEIQPARVSIMPQGLDKTLTTEQLSDLITFLQTLK